MSLKILPVGGRIKAASVGMDHLPFGVEDSFAVDQVLRGFRKQPPRELLTAFFPGDRARIRQLLESVGLFRPSLKTDQGMPGNFGSFVIDPCLPCTSPVIHRFGGEEFLAIPEPHAALDASKVLALQEVFYAGDLAKTAEMLTMFGSRVATRGRTPFFLIRTAETETPCVFGMDTIDAVQRVVQAELLRIMEVARGEEERETGTARDARLLFCQPDVFIARDGGVTVERINCPDVGLFLTEFHHPSSLLLPLVQSLMQRMKSKVSAVIAAALPETNLVLLTRDEVLQANEDLLELGEIRALCEGLANHGKMVRVQSLSQVGDIVPGTPVILLNLDYQASGIAQLLQRHARGEIECFPNPYFQRVCQSATGLMEVEVPTGARETFLQLVRAEPKNEQAHRQVIERIGSFFPFDDSTPILYGAVGKEVVPVIRRSLFSWRQLGRRLAALEECAGVSLPIRIRKVPTTPATSRITSSSGPRVHVYRFMVTA